MNGRTKSLSALESSDGNWVLSVPNSSLQGDYNGYPGKDSNVARVSSGTTVVGVSNYPMPDSITGTGELRVESYLKNRSRSNHASRRYRTNHRHHSAERHLANNNMTIYRHRRPRDPYKKSVPRVVVLCKADGEFGFSLRQIPSALYGRKSMSAFTPTARVPALQLLNYIEPGSLSDKAGLKPGDYVIEINDECVTCSPHQYVVYLIKSSADILKLKVVEGLDYLPESPSVSNNGRYAFETDINMNLIPQRKKPEFVANGGHGSFPHRSRIDVGTSDSLRPGTVPQTNHTLSRSKVPEAAAVLPENRPMQSKNATITNIRLSRFAGNDQVSYDSSRKRNWKIGKVIPESQFGHSAHNRIPRTSSAGNIKTLQRNDDKDPLDFSQDLLNRQKQGRKRISKSLMDEASILSELEREALNPLVFEEVSHSSSSTPEVNHTYDRIRPVDIPFETEEGYIRLGGNVDYVAQVDLPEEPDHIDFLAMAEKIRKMYLNSKSISQPAN